MQGRTATTRHGVTRKEAQKRLQDRLQITSVKKGPTVKRCLLILDLKPLEIKVLKLLFGFT